MRERLVFAVIVGLLALGAVGAVVAPPGTSSAVKRFDLRFKLVSSSAQAARGGVAISGDGDTVLVGGDVFVRSGATWTRQAILSPVGATDFGFGVSVALSANGNTALIGDPYPQSSHGGTPSPPGVTTPAAPSAPPPSPPGQAFVFVRVGSSWTQQGPALVPGDAVGHPGFADAVALSADGRTVLIGGPGDNCCVPVPGTRFAREVGAAWVFTRVGSGWVQQGLKLTPPDAQSPDRFGARVSLSANGDTALIGSYRGNIGFDVEVSAGADAGAVWVQTRSGSAWAEQARLIGTGSSGLGPNDVYHVALSADGNTALVGGDGADDTQLSVGGAWFFVRSGSTWTQQGAKLVPSKPTQSHFGRSVALSGDGYTALIGMVDDKGGMAAVYIRSKNRWSQLAGPPRGSFIFGEAIALSSNGATAAMGNGQKPAWVFYSAD